MSGVYYNENDQFSVRWLRNLIAAGLIAPGDIDDRSICDVKPSDLDGYVQHHFFAGIGGWSYALRLAGWPDDRPIATGSCPCQPFSSAGKGEGVDDERHLWPAFRWLIAQRRFPKIAGEQVASADGRQWLDGVRADLEALGYVFGAGDLCAASVGAPHIRQRLYWLADSAESTGKRNTRAVHCSQEAGDGERVAVDGPVHQRPANGGANNDASGLGYTKCERWEQSAEDICRRQSVASVDGKGGAGWLGDSDRLGSGRDEPGRGSSQRAAARRADAISDFWSDFGIVFCDERRFGRGIIARRVEPGTFPLAHGIPGRVGRLRGYGNAIVPDCAAMMIRAWMETQ